MAKISVIINTLNEEANLERALTSIKKLADEIVVVDMHSDDRTVAIAKSYGAKVYFHERTGYVEPARNFAISKATGDWLFILDADETASPELIKLLKEIVNNPTADYFRLPRKNLIFNKWVKYSRWWPDYNIRFFRKGTVAWSEIIHSVPTTQGKGQDLEAKEANAITHYNYESVEQYLERLNRYTSHQVKILVKNGGVFDWKDLIKKPVGEFLSRFFQGKGYLDGLHGLVLAILQAFSEFVLYLKFWQVEKFSEKKISAKVFAQEIRSAESEINYWLSDTLFREGGNLIELIKKKIRIP